MPKIAVLVFDSDLRRRLQNLLVARGFEVLAAAGTATALDARVVVVECESGSEDPGIGFLGEAQFRRGFPPIIAVALKSCVDVVVAAFRRGARDFFCHPFSDDEIVEALLHALPESTQETEKEALIGSSPEMRHVKAFINRLARVDTSVMITGETGTGKEVVARQIHETGSRRNRPMVCINCAAIPEGLLENELFGHERGAFTGAFSTRDGKVKEADGGTIFLDEIGDLSLMAQAKILRMIESKEVTPLGGRGSFQLDLRIIAATNRDLPAMVREERFRCDLLFRLNVARVKLPPLRDRPSDIPLLVQHFLPELNRRFGCRVSRFSDHAMKIMMQYSWPGNVRELRNMMEMAFLHLPSPHSTEANLSNFGESPMPGEGPSPGDERERLCSVLLSSRWNISEAARKLRWSRMTVYRKLAKYQMLRSTASDREAANVTLGDGR